MRSSRDDAAPLRHDGVHRGVPRVDGNVRNELQVEGEPNLALFKDYNPQRSAGVTSH